MRQVYWRDGRPTLEHGLFAAAWVMNMSITVAPGHVAMPIDIAVITDGKTRMLSTEEVQVHLEAARAATEHYAKFDPKKLDAGEQTPGEPPPAAIPQPPAMK